MTLKDKFLAKHELNIFVDSKEKKTRVKVRGIHTTITLLKLVLMLAYVHSVPDNFNSVSSFVIDCIVLFKIQVSFSIFVFETRVISM